MAKRSKKVKKKTKKTAARTKKATRVLARNKKTKSRKKLKGTKGRRTSKKTVAKGKRARSAGRKAPSVKRKAAVASATSKAKEKLIGRVIHYYDRIGVAIVDLKSPLKIGDTVRMKRGDLEWTEPVSSLQIEHMPVPQAKKGDVVGMKVGSEVREGTLVMPA